MLVSRPMDVMIMKLDRPETAPVMRMRERWYFRCRIIAETAPENTAMRIRLIMSMLALPALVSIRAAISDVETPAMIPGRMPTVTVRSI